MIRTEPFLVWYTHADIGHHMLCFHGALRRAHTCTYTWCFPGTPAKSPAVVQHVGEKRGDARERGEKEMRREIFSIPRV